MGLEGVGGDEPFGHDDLTSIPLRRIKGFVTTFCRHYFSVGN